MELPNFLRTVSRRTFSFAIGALVLPLREADATPRRAAPGEISVLDFGADPNGANDSTSAFTAAVAKGMPVFVPAGKYLVGTIKLSPGASVRGEGESSVLIQQPGGNAILIFDSSPAEISGAKPSKISNLQLRGACDSRGFSEFVMLAKVLGIDGLVVEGVIFRGFQGDGLYLGAASSHGPCHNRNVVVRHCLFDGMNNMNRNGISVIDCDGLQIEDCQFRNTSKNNMPGAIDLEPNHDKATLIHGVQIRRNRFDSNGGSAAIAMYIPEALDKPVSDVVIEDNVIVGVNATGFSLRQIVEPPQGGAPQGFIIRHNQVSVRSGRPFVLAGIDGVDVRDNVFEGCGDAASIGMKDPGTEVRRVSVAGNHFNGCGNVSGTGIAIHRVDGLHLTQNEFVDCGNGKPQATVIGFQTGHSAGVTFEGNRFSATKGSAHYAVRMDPDHQTDAASLSFARSNSLSSGLAVDIPGGAQQR